MHTLQQRSGVGAAVAQRCFFGNGVDAVRGRHQRRAVGRHQPALHGAAGFHQFTGQHHVHVTRQWHQCQHRGFAGGLCGSPGEQLDVINGGPGTLCHARHRGGLRDVAVVFAQVDDPVGQHAATFTTHGQDGDLDGLGAAVHALQAGNKRTPTVSAVPPRAAAASLSSACAGQRASGPSGWGC